MGESERRLLVRLVGMTDAVFLPIRSHEGNLSSNAGMARETFRARGLSWGSNEPDAAGRKRAHLTLEALAEGGMVTASTGKGARVRTFVKLTETGEAAARALAGLPSLGLSTRMLRHVASLSRRPARLKTDVWISELRLLGAAGYPQDDDEWDQFQRTLKELEHVGLPSLVRGWMDANSDCHGRTYYRVTEEGRAALEEEEPVHNCGHVEADDHLVELYMDCLLESLSRLSTAPPEPRIIGRIPLPASIQDVPV
jgi:DNA-binding MarR family transcriptional regulator